MATASSPLLQPDAYAFPPQYVTGTPIIDVQPGTYYTETDGTGRPAIFTICQNPKCNFKIYLAKTMHEQANGSVVNCRKCKEWTPFKPPPEGFRYVRCTCRMLIRCIDSANSTECPSCKTVIQLRANEPETIRERYHCPYNCINVFEIKEPRRYVRCDLCGRVSNIGESHTRVRVFFYVVFGILFAAGGIVTVVMTHEMAHQNNEWPIYLSWAGFGLLGFAFFVRAGWLARIKTSTRLPLVN